MAHGLQMSAANVGTQARDLMRGPVGNIPHPMSVDEYANSNNERRRGAEGQEYYR